MAVYGSLLGSVYLCRFMAVYGSLLGFMTMVVYDGLWSVYGSDQPQAGVARREVVVENFKLYSKCTHYIIF